VTDPVPGVVVAYDRFLEYQHERRKTAADCIEQDRLAAIDATGPTVLLALPETPTGNDVKH
jgi:hypothetical protein